MVFPVPVASHKSDRVFSIAGNVVTPKRVKLNLEKVEDLAVKLLKTIRIAQLVLVVALVACVSFGVGYGLKYGFYTKVTRSNITDVTSSDSLGLKQEEE